MAFSFSSKIGKEPEQDFQQALMGVLHRLGISELNFLQKSALKEAVLQKSNFMVVAPSGSGKTLVALMSVLKLLVESDENRKAVVLVPLKALALEQFTWVKNALGELGKRVAIDTGDYSLTINRGDLSTHQVLIMTYERFDSLIRSRSWWLKRIGLVVIDEINYLSEKTRGPRLEATIVRLKENLPYVQLVALCPPIGNADKLAEWLDCRLIVGDQRPIPLKLEVMRIRNRIKTILELTSKTVAERGSVIIFTSDRSACEQTAMSLLEPLQGVVSEKQKADARSRALTLLDSNDDSHVNSGKLASVMRGCVAFHHAGLSSDERGLVEKGFRDGVIKAIVCTTTLATGVNTPARLVIVADTTYVDRRSPGASSGAVLKRIELDRVHQMLGRAGRPGYDTTGHGVILVGSRAEEEFATKTYLNGIKMDGNGYVASSPLPIESKMNSEYALLEQLLMRIYECGECDAGELLDFIGKTFWWKLNGPSRRKVSFLLRADSYDASDALDAILELREKRSVNDPRIKEIYSKNSGADIQEKCGRDKCGYTIRIVNVSKERIDARVRESHGGAWVSCSISTSEARCECTSARLSDTHGKVGEASQLCQHLSILFRHVLSSPQTQIRAEAILMRLLSRSLPMDRLLRAGLVTIVNGKYACTDLGSIAATLYLHPFTVIYIKDCFRNLTNNEELDLRTIVNIALRSIQIECGDKPLLHKQDCAIRAIMQWIDEIPEEEIIKSTSTAASDLHEMRQETSRLLRAASTIARRLGLMKLSCQFLVLSERTRFGVKEDLIPLMQASAPLLGRRLVRELFDLGYTSGAELLRASPQELAGVARLTEDAAVDIKLLVERSKRCKENLGYS